MPIQFLDLPQKPSLGQRFSNAVGAGLQEGEKMLQENQREKAIKSLMGDKGEEIAKLPPDLQKLYIEHNLKGAQKSNEAAQELAGNKAKIADLEKRRDLAPGSLSAYENDPKMAEQVSRQAKEQKINQADRPIDPNQLDRIKKVRSLPEFQNASPSTKYQMLTDAGVSERNSKSEAEIASNEPKNVREEKINEAQATADVKFYNDLNDRKNKQIFKKDSLKRLESINKKGVSGKVYEKILDSSGLTAKTSEGRREFAAEVKNQFTDFKQIAGSQLSAQEFFILAGAYPNPDFSQEANQAIIDNLNLVHDTLDEEDNIAKRLKKENGGKIPEYFQEKVNTELQAYVSNRLDKMKENLHKIQNEQYGIKPGFTLMFDKNGDALSIPDDKVAGFMEDGVAFLP